MPPKTSLIWSWISGPLIKVGRVVLLVPYAVLVLKATAGRAAFAAALRVERCAAVDGVGGISCSENVGEVALALEILLDARVERRVVDIGDRLRPKFQGPINVDLESGEICGPQAHGQVCALGQHH